MYLLFGQNDDAAKASVYIGQTEDLKTRLKKHNSDKQFWGSVVAITSRTESFTQVHVRYLEWLSIEKAASAKRYSLENGNSGGKPFIPEPLEADVLDAFETASTLLSTLGYPVFESLINEDTSTDNREIFFCGGKLADGKGVMTDDGFVLLRGSLCRSERSRSMDTFLGTLDELIDSGTLAPHSSGQYILTEDYLCKSVSLAAAIVLARNASGWQEWKNSSGQSLDAVYRQSITSES